MDLHLPNETPEYIAEDRARELESAQESFPDDLEERFKPGSFGHFEMMDRAMVIMENWFQYIQDHPSVVLDEEVYTLAHQIGAALHEFYQRTASLEFDATEIQNDWILKQFGNWAEKAGLLSAMTWVQKYRNREPMGPFCVKMDSEKSGPFPTYAEAYDFYQRSHTSEPNEPSVWTSMWIEDATGQKWFAKHPDFHKLASRKEEDTVRKIPMPDPPPNIQITEGEVAVKDPGHLPIKAISPSHDEKTVAKLTAKSAQELSDGIKAVCTSLNAEDRILLKFNANDGWNITVIGAL